MAAKIDPDDLTPFYTQRSADEWWTLAQEKFEPVKAYYGSLPVKYWNDTDKQLGKAVYGRRESEAQIADAEAKFKQAMTMVDGPDASYLHGWLIGGAGDDVGRYERDEKEIERLYLEQKHQAEMRRSEADDYFSAWQSTYSEQEAITNRQNALIQEQEDKILNMKRQEQFLLRKRGKALQKTESATPDLHYGTGPTMKSLLGIDTGLKPNSSLGIG